MPQTESQPRLEDTSVTRIVSAADLDLREVIARLPHYVGSNGDHVYLNEHNGSIDWREVEGVRTLTIDGGSAWGRVRNSGSEHHAVVLNPTSVTFVEAGTDRDKVSGWIATRDSEGFMRFEVPIDLVSEDVKDAKRLAERNGTLRK